MLKAQRLSVFTFRGRIDRASFWTMIGAVVVATIAIITVVAMVVPNTQATRVNPGSPSWAMLVLGLVYLLALWLSAATYAKRLHDLDLSGWIALMVFIPVVNLILLIYCGAKPGTVGPNRFGSGPMRVSL